MESDIGQFQTKLTSHLSTNRLLSIVKKSFKISVNNCISFAIGAIESAGNKTNQLIEYALWSVDVCYGRIDNKWKSRFHCLNAFNWKTKLNFDYISFFLNAGKIFTIGGWNASTIVRWLLKPTSYFLWNALDQLRQEPTHQQHSYSDCGE